MVKRIVMCLIAVLITAPSMAEWNMTEFMITQWGRPKLTDDEAIARASAQAHINHVMWSADKLDLCNKYGLKVIVEQPTPDLAKKISGHPALWGYYITDEPYPESEFPPLAEKIRELKAADPDHPSFINTLSTTGDFLRTYMDVVKPELLSYDFYQWWWGSDRYYEKLEQFREEALLADIPLTCCIETSAKTVGGPDYLPDNAEKLRLNVYTALTYGVKGIQWFNADGIFEPESAKLSKSGMDIAAINIELEQLGPVLVKLRSTDVFHTPPLPKGTREAPTEHWIHLIGEENAAGLVLGMFKDAGKKRYMDAAEIDYFMVANRDYKHSQHVVVRFQSKWLGIAPWHKQKQITRAVEQFDRKTGEWKQVSSSCAVGFVFYIAAGDGELFRVTTTITQ